MSDLKHFSRMVKRAPRADVAILLITFLLTVFTDLVVAVNIGVILAMLQFLRRMAASVQTQQLTEKDLEMELAYHGMAKLPRGMLVYTIEGPFFFGAVENFERALAQTHTDARVLVLRLQRVPFMDITGLETLEEVIQNLARRHVTVILCGANQRISAKMDKAGILAMLGPDNVVPDFAAALARCEALLGTAPKAARAS